MTRLYPHKNTIGIALICALVVIGFTAYVRWGISGDTDTRSAATVSVTSSAHEGAQPLVLDDSIDWKKGVLALASSSRSQNTSPSQPLTLTDTLGRDFFESYVQLRQQNLSKDDVAVGNSVDSTIEDIVRQASLPPEYSSKDVTISASNDAHSLRTYGNTVALTFMNYTSRTNPLEIVSAALENEDMESLSVMDPIITSYKNLIQKLLATPTPSLVASAHIDLINAVSALGFITQKLRDVSVDPMQAMIALGMYTDAEKSLRSSLWNLKGYFEANHVAFETTDPGITFATITPNL